MTNPEITRIDVARVTVQSAYDRGQRFEAWLPSALVVVFLFAAWLAGAHLRQSWPWAALSLSLAWAIGRWGRSAGTARVRGGLARRLAVPALLGGLIPLACGLCAMHVGHVCAGGVCSSVCVPACASGGVVAGLILGRMWALQRAPASVVGSGFVLCASLASVGCSCAGQGGILAMTAALLFSGTLSYLLVNARRAL